MCIYCDKLFVLTSFLSSWTHNSGQRENTHIVVKDWSLSKVFFQTTNCFFFSLTLALSRLDTVLNIKEILARSNRHKHPYLWALSWRSVFIESLFDPGDLRHRYASTSVHVEKHLKSKITSSSSAVWMWMECPGLKQVKPVWQVLPNCILSNGPWQLLWFQKDFQSNVSLWEKWPYFYLIYNLRE